MSGLPKGWVETTIADITTYVQRGKGPKYSADQNDFPVINQKAIRWFGIQAEHLKYVREDMWNSYTEERFIKPGDILWNSTGTGTIGRACLLNANEAAKAKVVDSHVTILRTNQAVEPRYLFNWIKSPKIQFDIESLSTGTTNQVELSKAKVLATIIPLAPLNEQIRIADKLDSILAKVDQAQARFEKIPHILKRFRQSVLAAATSGELTREWREDNGVLLSDWGDKVFSELLLKIRSGSGLKPTDNFEGIPILRSSAVRNLVIDYEDFRYLSEIQAIKTQDYLSNDDLLFTRLSGSIEYVGNCARVQGVSDNSIQYPDRLFCARLKDRSHSRYLEIYFSSPKFGKYIVSSIKSSAGHQRITIGVLNNAAIQLPSIQEQNVIVHRVEALLIKADKVEKQYLESKARMDRLTQSILAKAFRGELVPQDPNDESADKLLKNIKAEHPKPKGKKK